MDNSYYQDKLELDLSLRNYSESTHKAYARGVRYFLEFCNKPAEDLTEHDVRDFCLSLMAREDLCNSSINLYQAAVRFFFGVTLNKHMNYLQMPRLKCEKSVPDILSREEVLALFKATEKNPKYSAIIALGVGSGLRISEINHLRIEDIDSKEMRLFVKAGKGKKDRHTILPQYSLNLLRKYWHEYRPNSIEGYLFPGGKKGDGTGCISRYAIDKGLHKYFKLAGITRESVTAHTLRHTFATNLIENGVDIYIIKELLGHSALSSTLHYVHATNLSADITSPLDCLLGAADACRT